MAKFISSQFMDGGFTAFKANVNQMALLKAYAAGDDYATVVSNIIASVVVESADFTLSDGALNSRVMTTPAGKSDASADASGATPDLHIVFMDTVNSIIYWATDETTDQVVYDGNPINFPSFDYTINQPT